MSAIVPQEIYLSYRDILIALWDEVHYVAPFSFRALDEIDTCMRTAEQLGVSCRDAIQDEQGRRVGD